MRTRVRGGGLQVTAVAGTGVVLLAFDCQHPALLGFIVGKRQAAVAGGWQHMHARYLGSMCEAAECSGGIAEEGVSQLIQSFDWLDCDCMPGQLCEYRVCAVLQLPTGRQQQRPLKLRIRTEPNDQQCTHQVQRHPPTSNSMAAPLTAVWRCLRYFSTEAPQHISPLRLVGELDGCPTGS